MAKTRVSPVARIGNYAAEVDTAGMDDSMKHTMGIRKPKTDKEYIKDQRARVNKDRARRGLRPL